MTELRAQPVESGGCHAAEHPHRASLPEHAAGQRMAHAPSRVGLTGQSDAAKGNTILIIIRHGTNTTKRGAKHTGDGGVPGASLTTHAHKYARAHDDRTRFLSLQNSRTVAAAAAAVVVTVVVVHRAGGPLRFSSWSSRAQNQRVHSLGRGIRLLAGCGGHESRREELPREGRVVVSFFLKRNESVRDHVGCGPAFAGESGTREILPSATRCPRCVMEGGCCVLSSTFLRAGVCGPRRWESLSLAGA